MTDGPASLPEIRLVDLSKHFREVRAVDSVSMEIHPGEFFSLLGMQLPAVFFLVSHLLLAALTPMKLRLLILGFLVGPFSTGG